MGSCEHGDELPGYGKWTEFGYMFSVNFWGGFQLPKLLLFMAVKRTVPCGIVGLY